MHHFLTALFLLLICATPLSAPVFAAPAPYYINARPAQGNSEEALNDVKQLTACEGLAGYQRFTDHPRGYSACVPAGLAPDFSLSAVRSLFSDGPTQIEFYYDDFRDSISTPRPIWYMRTASCRTAAGTPFNCRKLSAGMGSPSTGSSGPATHWRP